MRRRVKDESWGTLSSRPVAFDSLPIGAACVEFISNTQFGGKVRMRRVLHKKDATHFRFPSGRVARIDLKFQVLIVTRILT